MIASHPVSRQAVRCVRIGYLGAVALFLACIVVQVFLAGMAVLVNPSLWPAHVAFVSFFRWIVGAMLALGLGSRLPGRMLRRTFLVAALFALQYVLIYVPGLIGLLVLRALHPVNAVILFWLMTHLVRDAWQFVRGDTRGDVAASTVTAVITGFR